MVPEHKQTIVCPECNGKKKTLKSLPIFAPDLFMFHNPFGFYWGTCRMCKGAGTIPRPVRML